MNLKQYDGLCVRITDTDGEVFEGICEYLNAGYNEHEFGVDEHGLKIVNFVFYESGIQTVESLEKVRGHYGKFSEKYGLIEKMNVEDGIDSIRDVLFSEEEEHVYRALVCLEEYFDLQSVPELPCSVAELAEALEELIGCEVGDNVRQKAQYLLSFTGS